MDGVHTSYLTSRRYELKDHLGNVRTVLTDTKLSQITSNTPGDYEAEIVGLYDYFPFGMEQPGRTWSASGKYRYGFNGKEKDDNGEWGNTNYDYGFRIYNPSIGRFLSVDPLTKSYPMLTPYQFASNRPIDGVDLDGLEYIHYYVFLNKKGEFLSKKTHRDFRNLSSKQLEEIHGVTNAEMAYALHSQSFGPEGKGVKYTYFREGNDGRFRQYGEPLWEVRESLTRNGLYSGAGSITQMGPLFHKSDGNRYNFSVNPIDMQDAIAREHDIEEDDEYYTHFMDVKYIFADIRFVKKLDKFIEGVRSGEIVIDPFTDRPVSVQAYVSATRASTLFKIIIDQKKEEAKRLMEKGQFSRENFKRFMENVRKTEEQEVELPRPQRSK